jgi:hypothetical protein
MNDDFLTHFRKPPRSEFATDLYRRINQPMVTQPKLFALGRIALAISVLCAAFALTLFVSPTVRAAVLSFAREVGGLSFVETPDYPGDGETSLAPEEILSLSAAQTVLPFSFHLPTWAPEGFMRSEMVKITRFSAQYTPVSITWQEKQTEGQISRIELLVGQAGMKFAIGPDSIETVYIHEQPAALVRGAWNADTQQWDKDGSGVTLMWAKNEVTYQLSAHRISTQDLTRMAESIP